MKHLANLYYLFLKFYVELQMHHLLQAQFDRNLMLKNFQMLLLLKKKSVETLHCVV